jgi:type IV secretion system protein VirD4
VTNAPNARLGTTLLTVGVLVFVAYLAVLGWSVYTTLEAGANLAKPRFEAQFKRSSGLGGNTFWIRCQGDVACSAEMNKPFASSPVRSLATLGIIPVMLIGAGIGLRTRQFDRKDPGAQRWATRADLERAQLLIQGNEPRIGYYGLLRGTRDVIRVREDVRNRHTLIVSGPGGGKTSGYYRTNILCDAREGNTSFVFDLKYPDHGGLHDAIAFYRYFNRKVVVFAPFTERTHTLPILDLIQTQTDCNVISKVMVPRTPTSDEFHRGNAQDVLEALLWASKVTGKRDLGWLYELLKGGTKQVMDAISNAKDSSGNSLAKEYGDVLGLRADQFSGAVRNARKALESLTDPLVVRSLGRSENSLDLEGLLETPSLIYVGMPGIEIRTERAQMLLRLFKHFSDQAIERVATKHDKRLPHQTNIYLDEFRGFGLIPFIQNDLAERRSYRLAIHAALQNLAQGEAVYGRAEFASMRNSNFQNMVLFPAGIGLEEADYFSKLIGDTTDLETGKGQTTRGFADSSSSRNERLVKRRLIEAAEFKVYPEGEAIVVPFGAPPVKVEMPRLSEKQHPLHNLFNTIKAWETSAPPFEVASTPDAEQVFIPVTAPISPKAATLETLRDAIANAMRARVPLSVQTASDGKALEVIPPDLEESMLAALRALGWLSERDGRAWINRRGVKALGGRMVTLLSGYARASKALQFILKNPDAVDDPALEVKRGNARFGIRLEANRILLTSERSRNLYPKIAPEQLENVDLATRGVYASSIPLPTQDDLEAARRPNPSSSEPEAPEDEPLDIQPNISRDTETMVSA